MKAVKIGVFVLVFLASGMALTAAIPSWERQALIDLYYATNGANWTNNADWLGAEGTEGSWYGVSTSGTEENETVYKLELPSNNLVGSIPSSLGNLSNLQFLRLGYNQLTGSIPPEIGNISSLLDLGLNNNQLTGSIPAELGNRSNLQLLRLYENQLTGNIPSELGNLSILQELLLYSNQLTGSIPSSLGNLNNLQELWLYSNQLSGSIPMELGQLSNLLNLDLGINHLEGNIPTEIGNLSNLTDLWLYCNKLSGEIPYSLTNLTNLQSGHVGLHNNALYSLDDELTAFLDSKETYWAASQTITPTEIEAVPGNASVTVTWTPIAYTGGYRVYVAEEILGVLGSYTFYAQTEDKTVSSQLVSGLTNGHTYCFKVQTRTAPNACDRNTVDSEYSAEVCATPLLIYINKLTITSPNGSETWSSGSVHNITWTTEGTVENVKLEYSTDTGSNWTTIIDSTPNTNSYPWTTPAVNSTNCLVRVSDASAGIPWDVSDAVFTIAATIVVTSPNGGETWTSGEDRYITWSSTGAITNVNIEYSADTSRVMLIQNYTNNVSYRSTCGFYNPTADSITVEYTLLNGSGAQIGSQFSKTLVGHDFVSFSPFTEAGVAYPANSYDNVILRVRPTSGTGSVMCFGASANNASNDPASHLAVQGAVE